MNTANSHYSELIKRIQFYYPQCQITQPKGHPVIALPLGKLQVKGYHVSFYISEKRIAESDFENPDELYEGIEAYILTLLDEEKRCNPTFLTALKNSEKRCRRTLHASAAGFLLLGLGCHLLDLSIAALWIALLLPIAALPFLRFVRLLSFRRDWVCPHCGAPLPVEKKAWTPQPQSVSCCPQCGKRLLDRTLVQQRCQELLKDTEVQSQIEEIPDDSPVLPSRYGAKSCKVWGILLVIYGLFLLLPTFRMMDEASPVHTAIHLGSILCTFAAAIALLRCRSPQTGGTDPKILVCERSMLTVLGTGICITGLLVLLISFLLSKDDLVVICFFVLMGLGLLLSAIWMLLARVNRRLMVFETRLVYTTSFGNLREVSLSQIGSVQVTINEAIVFRSQSGKRLFSVESNMVGAGGLMDWIERQNLPVTISKAMKKQLEQDTDVTVSWREAYRTPMHKHMGAIRAGLFLVILLFAAGCVVPLALFLFTDLKMTHAVYLTALSPIPMIVYYIVFAPVLLVTDRPNGASNEWNAMHIKFPTLLVVMLTLLSSAQVYYFWDGRMIQVVGYERFLIPAVILTAGMIALVQIRTPRRLRKTDFSILYIILAMLGYVMTYGANLAISKPVPHYPAVVTARSEPTEKDKDADRTLTVLLDDGTAAELNVTEKLFDMEKSGADLDVCQRENFLGIRFVRLHLHKEP